MWQLLFLSVYFSQRCRSTVTYFFFCLLHLCYQLIISNYAALLHSSFYSVEDFSVQTCSKCLQWMPQELFQTRTVENKTVSVQRDLLTFKSHTSDIKNPRTFQVNTDFLISKDKGAPLWCCSFTATNRQTCRRMNFSGVCSTTSRWDRLEVDS